MNQFMFNRAIRQLRKDLFKMFPNVKFQIGNSRQSKSMQFGRSGFAYDKDNKNIDVIVGVNLKKLDKDDFDVNPSYDVQFAVIVVNAFHELHHIKQDSRYRKGEVDQTLYEYIVIRSNHDDFYDNAINHDMLSREIEADAFGLLGAVDYVRKSKYFDNNLGNDIVKNYFRFKQQAKCIMYTGKYLPKLDDIDNFDCSEDSISILYDSMIAAALSGTKDGKDLGGGKPNPCNFWLKSIHESSDFGKYIRAQGIFNEHFGLKREDERIFHLAAAVVGFNEYVNNKRNEYIRIDFLSEYPFLSDEKEFMELVNRNKQWLESNNYDVSNVKSDRYSRVIHTLSDKDIKGFDDIRNARVAEVDMFNTEDDSDISCTDPTDDWL